IVDSDWSTDVSSSDLEDEENQTQRLVIYSFTAMSPAFQTVGDLRTFTHVLLGKIVGGATGCTTLLITEEGTGKDLPWTGVEERRDRKSTRLNSSHQII